MQQPLGFHPHPKLELIGRDGDEISGHVFGGKGVHAGAALAGVDAVKFVFHQDVALLCDELVELFFQLAQRGVLFSGLGRSSISPRR